MARKLENELTQYKSAQPVRPQAKSKLKFLVEQDPKLVDELMNKKKWNYVQKDPARVPVNN